jgi:hypothetical protein
MYKYNELQVSFTTKKLSCKASCKTPFFFIVDVPQGNTSSGNSHNDDDELEGNGALDIHLDLPVMAYL